MLLVSPVETTELALNGGVATPDRPQSVKVEFRVVDNSGSQAPVQGQLVCFELSTSVGGIEFSPTQTITGSDGLASTTVSSGNVSTPVVVTATVAGAANSSSCAAIPQGARITQNDNIIISTGLPDQDGFSLAVSNLSPEAFAVDGVTVGVTASVNDLFNNPVRDGVVVFFTTAAGKIQDQCATPGGRGDREAGGWGKGGVVGGGVGGVRTMYEKREQRV